MMQAALEFLLQTGRQPDILHCHDWSTAGVAQSFWQDYQPYGLWRPKVVFTIHNADFGMARLGSAAHHCQQFTTVSPSYAFEVGPQLLMLLIWIYIFQYLLDMPKLVSESRGSAACHLHATHTRSTQIRACSAIRVKCQSISGQFVRGPLVHCWKSGEPA